MSLLARRSPRTSEARDLTSAPWVDGRTVPTPLQDMASGYRYVPLESLRVAAAVACIGLRSGAFMQMPLKGYDANGLANPQPELLAAPSAVVVPSIWKAQMSISRDCWGYAVGVIAAVDGAGYPANVEWINPDRVVGKQATIGSPIEWRIDREQVDPSRIMHIPSRWVAPGSPIGMSPLEHSGLIDLARKVQNFGRDWFDRGAVPSAILYSDEVLTTKQADDMLARLLQRWRQRQPGVLGAGLKYEQVSVKANESQFLETATRAAADIAISFNMPPEKIGAAIAGQSVTYANRDQAQQQYLIDCINPDLVVIQESIERHMRPGTYPRWNTGALLRSDLKTRYEVGKIGVEAQLIHPDEWRATEDLPPLTPDQLATMPKIKASATTTTDGGAPA